MKYTPDFSSRFRILKGGKISLVVSALIAGSTMSFASPTGGQVTSGSATINQNGSITTINQSTNKASINWQSFNIAPSETVNFVQPSSQSVTLNRVIGATPSLIQGALNANGQVFLLNPNGVLFANGSQINVGGLVASTLNITDANFQAGNYTFEGNSQNSIINMGTITTAQGGYVAMMGKTVANEGTIVATMGNVQLAGGDKISLNLNGNSLVKLTIDEGTLNALVENKGLIQADGGQVYLTTQALNTILDGMVNNTGVIEASSLTDVGGKIALLGDVVVNSGSLLATGKTGGGEILVGGDVHGSHADLYGEAKYALLGKDSVINASATDNGNGGKIAVWSNLTDGLTLANGILKAEAGANGGNGGFIETSGHTLDVIDGTQVSTNAPKGIRGSWLLDPVDITICHGDGCVESAVTINQGHNGEGYVGQSDIDFDGLDYSNPNTTLGSVTDPTQPSDLYAFSSATSYIKDTTIEAALDAGTSVYITTYNSMQSAAGDITIQDGVEIRNSTTGRDWQGDAVGLYLYANRNIIANGATIGATSAATPLNVGFFANDAEITRLDFIVDSGYGDPYAYYDGMLKNAHDRYSEYQSSLTTPGYIKIYNTNFNTYGGSVALGGSEWGYYANGDASNPGVSLDTVHIYTAGYQVENAGSVAISGSNSATGGIGVKIINSIIDTSDSANNAGGVYIDGVGTGGDAINMNMLTLTGAEVYLNAKIFGAGTTATNNVGIRLKDTTVQATNVGLYAADGFDLYDGDFDNYTDINNHAVDSSLINQKAMGMSFESGTAFEELSAGDGVNLSIYDNSFYGVSLGDSTNGGATIGSTTGPLSIWYTKDAAAVDAKTFSYIGNSPLTLHSNGSGTVSFVNYSSDWHDTNDAYPTIVGGATMGATQGIWFSDTDLNKWVKSTIFDTAMFNEFENDNTLIVQNYNLTSAIGSSYFFGDSITLKNTATIKKSPTNMAFVTNAYEDWSTFNDEGATFSGTGDYYVYVWNSDAITRTALTLSDGNYYFNDRRNVFGNNDDDSLPPVGSYVLCADGTCGALTNGGSGNSGGDTPTTPIPTTTTNTINNVVTTIVNSTTVTPPAPVIVTAPQSTPQQVQTQTQNNVLVQSIMTQQGNTAGGSYNLLSTTDGVTPTQTLTLDQLQKSATAQGGVGEIRVPLGQDSVVELINGGVNLPQGVSQEFYIVASNTTGTTTTNSTTGNSSNNKKTKKN